MCKLCIFVGGIHGTGKSFFAANIASKSGLCHVSASQLIYNQTIKDKNVDSISINQDILVKGFNSLPISKYIMDGHYTVLEQENIITRVPLDTFISLKPQRLILLKSDTNKIYQRLLKRDNKQYSLGLLKQMQEEEEKYYLELCSYFEINIEIVENDF
jgi:adenylate kinase